MVRDARLTTVVNGGSSEISTLTLKVLPTDASNGYALSADQSAVAERGPANPGGGAFWLLMKYRDMKDESGMFIINPTLSGRSLPAGDHRSACFPWNATAQQLQSAFEQVLPRTAGSPEVDVHRTGRGDASSNWGYEHRIAFSGPAVRGDMQLVALKHLGLDGVLFEPTKATVDALAVTGAATDGWAAQRGAVAFGLTEGSTHYPGNSTMITVVYMGAFEFDNGTKSVQQIMVSDTKYNYTAGVPLDLGHNLTLWMAA